VEAISWLSRLEIWGNAGRMMADYPVVGAGLYAFDPVSRANYVYQLFSPNSRLTHAHNLALQTGATLGWGGLLALVGLWVVIMAGLWRAGRLLAEPRGRRLAAVLGASLAGYLVFNCFDTITLGQKPGLLVWLVLAGGGALAGRLERGKAPVMPGRWTDLLVAAPLLLFLLLLPTPALARNRANLALDRVRLAGVAPPAWLTARQFAGDARRAGLITFVRGDTPAALATWRQDPQAVAFLHNQGTLAAYRRDPAAALGWYNLALALEPGAAEVYYWRGATFQAAGATRLALADYERAFYLAPARGLDVSLQARIAFDWGRLLAGNGEWPAAVAILEQAVALDSNVPLYYKYLGDALMAGGDEARAAAAYQKAGLDDTPPR
ncbi:MAG: O-antigen ligase family protein, partial [Chloroflexi bacterium]|nr:O-antigen ligase family protein [Chloroflexota bacterium]